MALQSRRSKHFQPAKLTEWTSGKEIFFIRCRKRTTSGTRRSDSYLCVREHSQVKKPAKTSPSKENQPAQDQSKESKATESSKSHEDKPGEAMRTSQGEGNQAEEKLSQGNIEQAEEESSQGIEQAVEETSQNKDEKVEGKSSKEDIKQAEEKATKSNQNNDDQSDNVFFKLFEAAFGLSKHGDCTYSVGCEPRIDKHNDKDTFMLFRLLKSKIKKSMYLEP